MKSPFIYVLVDPRSPEHIRYVGMAINPQRPYQHVKIARSGKRTYVYNWIRSLFNNGVEPLVLFIEECELETVRVREHHYIQKFHAAGHQLTNMIHSAYANLLEVRKAKHVRIISPERWEQIKAKISAALKGHPPFGNNKERSQKISAALKGIKRSAETRAKISASKKGIPSPRKITDPNHIKPSRRINDALKRAHAHYRRVSPSEETKEKMRQAMARYYADPLNRKKAAQRARQQFATGRDV